LSNYSFTLLDFTVAKKGEPSAAADAEAEGTNAEAADYDPS